MNRPSRNRSSLAFGGLAALTVTAALAACTTADAVRSTQASADTVSDAAADAPDAAPTPATPAAPDATPDAGPGSSADASADTTPSPSPAADASADAPSPYGQTPGTYSNWTWPSQPAVLTDVDFFITVNVDPGEASNVFFSNQFSLSNTYAGYTGLQTNLQNGGRLFLYSLWGATSADPGDSGATCTPFSEDGTGVHCAYWYPWQVGHTYEFHLASTGGGAFNVTVSDTSGSASFSLGTIQTDPSLTGIPSSQPVSQWTEYFEWNDPRSTCQTQPYSSATFGLQANGGTIAPISAGTSLSTACPTYSQATVNGSSSTEVNGIGDSTRGAVLSPSGQCLNAEAGASNGDAAILYACAEPLTPNEAWVYAADQTLRLTSNYCLTAAGTGSGALVTLQTCSPASSPLEQWTFQGGQIASVASGLCLTTDPGTVTAMGNAQVYLSACTGASWQMPPGP